MGSEKLFAPAADKGKRVPWPHLLASRKGQDTFQKSSWEGMAGLLGKRVGSRLCSIMGQVLDAEPEAGVMCCDLQPPSKSYKESRSQEQWFPKWGSCPFPGTVRKTCSQTLPRLMGSAALRTTGSLWSSTC